MRNIIGAAALAFLFSLSAYGQGGNIPNTVIQNYVGAPAGVCTNIMVATNVSNGDFYDCLTGSWNKVTGGGAGSGTVTSIATTAPLGGGTITTTGTVTCTTCVVASSPGVGLAHFAGSTQTVTSSTVATADIAASAVTEAKIGLSDVTTNNATTSAHGFVPKLDNVATHFYNGQGGFTTPAGGGSGCNPAGAAGVVQASNGSGACQDTLATDNGTSLTYTGTGGIVANSGITAGASGSGAGFVKMGQGTAIGHATANNIVVESPASVTAYELILPGTSASGVVHRSNSSNVDTESVSAVVGSDMTNNTVTATQLAAQYSKGQCTEVWGGSGTSFAMTAGDDAIANNSCYNDSGVTRTITAVKCRADNASNTTVLTPTFGSAGTGTAILTGTLTCGNSYAYSSTGTVNSASWTTGTGIDPGMSTVGNATSIAMLVEFTY